MARVFPKYFSKINCHSIYDICLRNRSNGTERKAAAHQKTLQALFVVLGVMMFTPPVAGLASPRVGSLSR
jgi:hypothetical protein